MTNAQITTIWAMPAAMAEWGAQLRQLTQHKRLQPHYKQKEDDKLQPHLWQTQIHQQQRWWNSYDDNLVLEQQKSVLVTIDPQAPQ